MTPELLELEAATPGWLHPGEGEMLAEYATDRFAIEIGSYCGKSTLWIGSTARHVISIDPHRGNPEMQPGRDCHHPKTWDDELGMTDSLPALRRTMHKAGMVDKVTVIGAPSTRVAPWLSIDAGFVFIDGSHDGPDPLNDYTTFGRPLSPGAVLAFHDCPIPAVGAAIAGAEADGFHQIDAVGSLRVFER